MHDTMYDKDQPYVESRTSPVLSFIARIPFFNANPLLAVLVSLLLIAPFLYLVWFAPSLFVTDAPMAVLAKWLDARAIVDQPPSLAIADAALQDGSFLYLMLVNAGTTLSATPGQAMLIAQALMALILVGPLSYGSAMRLPLLPSLVLTLFILFMLLSPAAGILGAEKANAVAVFLWLTLISYGRPGRVVLACAQTEGVLAGIGLWYLYMSATPLFLAAFAGLIAALIIQERRGLVFTSMALSILLILGASSELLAYMALEHWLVVSRLEALGSLEAVMPIQLPHLLAFIAIPLGLLLRQNSGIVTFLLLSLMIGTGGTALIFFGADILPLLILCGLMAVFSNGGGRERATIARMESSALAGMMAITLMPFVVVTSNTIQAGQDLFAQYGRPALVETASFGFSFEDKPERAQLILSRKLDPAFATKAYHLTPADQAVLMQEGLHLVEKLVAKSTTVGLVSAADMSRLCADAEKQLHKADIVLTPRLAIDPLTNEARMSSQRLLYAEYKRAERTEQISPVYDIWVRRQN